MCWRTRTDTSRRCVALHTISTITKLLQPSVEQGVPGRAVKAGLGFSCVSCSPESPDGDGVAADSSRVPHLGTGVPRYPWVGVGVGARFPSLARMGDLGLQLPKLQFFFGGATFPHFRSFATKHRPPERNRSSFQSKHRKRGLTPPDPMRSNARIAGQPGAMSREIVNDFHPMQLPNR